MAAGAAKVMIALAAALAASVALPSRVQAAPRSVSVAGKDGARFVLTADRDLRRAGGRRLTSFALSVQTPAMPGGITAIGGSLRRRAVALAAPRSTSIGAFLECGGGGASFMYGTAGAGVSKVVAVLADGRRLRMQRFSAPTGWHYRGAVFLALVRARVALLHVRGSDARGRRIAQRYYLPPAPCSGPDFPPPAPSTGAVARPDPRILTGAVAERLVRAERRWLSARIGSYDFQLRETCFCAGSRPGWLTFAVRRGRPVRGGPLLWLRGPVTVPALFAAIVAAIEGRPSSLTVRYGRYGVPLLIAEDPSPFVLDEQHAEHVRRFRRR